ncbi:MAG: YggS family pyridoxal phosphate-dependent enzyme [Marinilabiliaceae bacterium]|nr:YggS family pyridoxal phosphate-dependent enzyme [Marinilabiliaceae bacterium]
MMSIAENLRHIQSQLTTGVTLVAVSKTHSQEAVMEAYQAGQRIFGENKVQELTTKYEALPKDIHWHMIGHMQSNKVKYIAPFVTLIHGVDSLRLLQTINKEGQKIQRVIPCLLQVHIASEETKFGFSPLEIKAITPSQISELPWIEIQGLMGMATFTDDNTQVRKEFDTLKQLFDQLKSTLFTNQASFNTLSMGMSDDFHIAIEAGSTLVRVGSSIFGHRDYTV